MSSAFVNRADILQGLGSFLQTPLARGALKYWWVSLPLAGLGYHYYRQRQKHGGATVGNVIHDVAPPVMLVATLLTLNEYLASKEQAAPASPAVRGPVTDAQFTTSPVTQGPPDAQLVQ